MPGKFDIEKLTWGWVSGTQLGNVTQEHVEISYRLQLPKCPTGACRRNCDKNPNCFEGLWKENEEEPCNSYDDLGLREEGCFGGLVNLGATCYVNCTLQLWYHNHALRRAIYNYQLPLSDQQSDDDCNLENYAKGDHVGQLQCLFALLQFSQRKNIDPTFFTKSLELDADEQQDPQEFSMLLLSLIEDLLKEQGDLSVRNIIPNLFQGSYEYNTRCNFCTNVSVVSSTFYEISLNVGDQKSLLGCLQQYVKEEKLEGEEQYECGKCKKKRDAVRSIKLKELPPFLHLQLLRFVYHRKTLKKTKLTNLIKFPEVLDMSSFIETHDPIVYDLNAVLIHRGKTADEGHYVAVIKDEGSNQWYEFSDSEVKKLEGTLQLDGDEEPATKKSRVKQLAKGMLSSQYAYMLVYQKRTVSAVENQDLQWNISPRLDKVIKADHKVFEDWLPILQKMKDEHDTKLQQEEELLRIWKELPAVPGDEWELLSIAWINKWLSRVDTLEPINNQCQLCVHEKMPLNAVTKFKCVKKQVVELLYKRFGGGPRIMKDSLCKECVERECLTRRIQMQLHDDAKIVNLKSVNKGEKSFWVGKKSFQSWQKLALQSFLPPETNCQSPDVEEFNSDLLCTHGNLNVNKSTRKLVSQAAWEILQEYFPTAFQYSRAEEECLMCQDLELNENETKRELAHKQRSVLGNLCHGKNRPQMDIPNLQCYAVLPRVITSLKASLSLSSKCQSVVEVRNSDILCKHGQLICPIIDTDKYVHPQPDERPVLLWEEEWRWLQDNVKVDQELIVTTVADDTQHEMAVTVKHQPEICPECYVIYCAAQSDKKIEQLHTYENSSIYIRRVPDNDDDTKTSSGDSKVVPSSHIKTGVNRNKQTKSTNNFNGQLKVTAKSNKRKKMCDMTHGDSVEAAKVRRSSRCPRPPGDVQVKVSSHSTLTDLKLKIQKRFGVAPIRQRLSLNSEEELTNSDATMKELRVVPDSTIYLKVVLDVETEF